MTKRIIELAVFASKISWFGAVKVRLRRKQKSAFFCHAFGCEYSLPFRCLLGQIVRFPKKMRRAPEGTAMRIMRFLLCVLLSCLSGPVAADTTLFEANPNALVLISKNDVDEIRSLFAGSQDPAQVALIQSIFTKQGLVAPTIRPIAPATIAYSMTLDGNALLVTSQDSGSPLLDSVYDIEGIQFSFVTQTTEAVSVTVTHGGQPIIGSGTPIAAEDGTQVILLANGDISENYRTLLVPVGTPVSDVSDLLGRAGIRAGEIREFTNSDTLLLKNREVALLSDASGFQQAALRSLPALYTDPRVYLLKDTIAFEDVTDLIHRAPAALTESSSAVQVALVDYSEALGLGDLTDARPSYQAEPRQYASFDFADLPPDQCNAVLPQQAVSRVALVVGNGAYLPNIGWLENPPNDADALADLLYASGFAVYFATEAKRSVIEDCLNQIVSAHDDLDISLLYYAGHGLQVDDQNYLLGIDAGASDTLTDHLISVDQAMSKLRGIAQSTLILLDACRDNPFAGGQSGLAAISSGTIDATQGAQQNDFAIVYAAAPNAVALDGTGENSPFTTALKVELAAPGIHVQEAIVRISAEVQRATNYQQQPFIRSNLTRLIYLNGDQSLEDLVEATQKASAEATALIGNGRRVEALAKVLSQIPVNATNADLTTDFAQGYEVARSLYFSQVDILENLPGPLYAATKIGENDRYFTLSADTYARLINVEDGKTLFEAFLDVDPVSLYRTLPSLSKDGSLLAFATEAQKAYLLDAETGELRYFLDALEQPQEVRSYSSLNGVDLSPNGERLLIKFYAWNILINTNTGQEIAAFGSINTGMEQPYHIGALDLADDHLCFLLKPAQLEDQDHALVGYLDLSTLKLGKLLRIQDHGFIDKPLCSQDGRYIAFSAYSEQTGLSSYNVIDLEQAKAVIQFVEGSSAGTGSQGYFSPNKDQFVLTTGTDLAVFDLNERVIVYSEPFQQWHWNIGGSGTLYIPPHGHIAQTADGTSIEKLDAVAVAPTRFIDIALASLPGNLLNVVTANRPFMPNE